MVYLADNHKKGNIQLKEISLNEEISEKYLSQIVIPLKNAGFITSKRGSNGGYSLTVSPDKINLKQIIEIFEGSLYPTDCAVDQSKCNKSTKCSTILVWKKIGDVLSQTLENITLEEIVKDFNKNKKVINYSI